MSLRQGVAYKKSSELGLCFAIRRVDWKTNRCISSAYRKIKGGVGFNIFLPRPQYI